MVPILLRLCSDPVYTVRESAAGAVPNFIESLTKMDQMEEGLREGIRGFANSTSFVQRIQ
jgi:hypothetical protein